MVAMKPRGTLKTFSALSFAAGQITDGTVPPIQESPLRLTPESVRGLTARPDGSADGDSPEDKRPATTRHCGGPDSTKPERVRYPLGSVDNRAVSWFGMK